MIIDSLRQLEDSITETEEASEPLYLTDLVPFFQTDSQMAVSRNRFARCQNLTCNNNSFTSELVFGVTKNCNHILCLNCVEIPRDSQKKGSKLRSIFKAIRGISRSLFSSFRRMDQPAQKEQNNGILTHCALCDSQRVFEPLYEHGEKLLDPTILSEELKLTKKVQRAFQAREQAFARLIDDGKRNYEQASKIYGSQEAGNSQSLYSK